MPTDSIVFKEAPTVLGQGQVKLREGMNVEMRRRARRYWVGIASATFLLSLFIATWLAEFISPYSPGEAWPDLHLQRLGSNAVDERTGWKNAPPMLLRLHFFYEGHFIGPFVYGLKREGRASYTEDGNKLYPLKFFASGYRYRLLGFFETDVHLFSTSEPPESPGQFFLLGTDDQGRDLLARTLAGGRNSLTLSLVAALLSLLLAIPFGGWAAYRGGWADLLSQRLAEGLMAWPRLALILAVSAILAAQEVEPLWRLWATSFLLAAVSWVPIAQVLRGQVLSLREEPFILAAQALGAGPLRILQKHLLPNLAGTLVVSATLLVPNLLILESITGYIWGTGTLASWGSVLKTVGSIQNLQYYPWWLIPAGFLMVTVIAFNLLGDALRDAVSRR